MKPKYEVSEIIQRSLSSYIQSNKLSTWQINTLNAIGICRSAKLGGHVSGCKSCGTRVHHYNSCRNRHCPKCQATNRERWILAREAELLPVAYYHIVFTLPSELNELALQDPKAVYDSLFEASWQTIKTFGKDAKHLGAKVGMTAVLHTWGQQLWLHPHLHCIVPGGGLTHRGKWKNSKSNGKYLFPRGALSNVYRAKYLAALRKRMVVPQAIAKKVIQKDWVVYAKRPFLAPKTVVEYLGRYTHKIAISNHRLLSLENQSVTFKYKNYKTGQFNQTLSLSDHEFLRRFSLHILPKGFTRMRHYGILSSRNKSVQINLIRSHFNLQPWSKVAISWEEIAQEKWGVTPGTCQKCGGEMEIVAVILPMRGPPKSKKS